MPCSTNPRVCFISTQSEFYVIKLPNKYFSDLTLVDDVFEHMSRFLVKKLAKKYFADLTLVDNVLGHMSRFLNSFALNFRELNYKSKQKKGYV